MTSPRDARLAYALLKLKQARIAKALTKVQAYTEQEPGDRNGTRLGAARLGFVQTTDPDTRATVIDPELFAKWVQERRPDEVVPTVRDSFRTALLNQMNETGALVDWNGEEVPGVGFASASPAQRFQAAPGADELLDVLAVEDLPQIDGVDLAGLLGVRAESGEPGE